MESNKSSPVSGTRARTTGRPSCCAVREGKLPARHECAWAHLEKRKEGRKSGHCRLLEPLSQDEKQGGEREKGPLDAKLLNYVCSGR